METDSKDQSPGSPATSAVTGEAIAAWKVGGRAYLVVRVAGDGPNGEDVEYLGSVSEEALARVPPEEHRRTLLEAVRVERDRTRALAAIQVRGLVGPVEL